MHGGSSSAVHIWACPSLIFPCPCMMDFERETKLAVAEMKEWASCLPQDLSSLRPSSRWSPKSHLATNMAAVFLWISMGKRGNRLNVSRLRRASPPPTPQRMPLPRETKASQGHNITLKPPVTEGPPVRPPCRLWCCDAFVREETISTTFAQQNVPQDKRWIAVAAY